MNFLDLPGRRTPAELRAEGVRCSIGEIIAITEDHCLPDARWCAAILESHRLPHAAIGGTVDKLSPDTALNWAVYFADYLRYSSPMPLDGPTGSLTDLNVTYKRAALEAIREVWEDELSRKCRS